MRPKITCYAMVNRDGIGVHFESYGAYRAEYREDPKVSVKCGAYFLVDDVDALYEEFKSRGLDPIWPPTDQGDGLRDMKVLDLDGYQLLFGTPVRGSGLEAEGGEH